MLSLQRLTHEREVCPILRMQNAKKAEAAVVSTGDMKRAEKKIPEDDPLFGVVAESQVGTLPGTSREKIAPKILEGMRQYLTVVEGPEKVARKERIKRSLMDLENDPLGQKTFLRLEPAPIVTTKLDKQKG